MNYVMTTHSRLSSREDNPSNKDEVDGDNFQNYLLRIRKTIRETTETGGAAEGKRKDRVMNGVINGVVE
jgi:hypothetical protein